MALLYDVTAPADYLQISSALVTAAPFTFALWMYPDRVGTAQSCMSCGQNITNNNYWRMWQASADTLEWSIRGPTGPARTAGTVNAMSVNTWHHCAAVERASDDRTVFLDFDPLDSDSRGDNTQNVAPSAGTLDRTRIGLSDELTAPFSGRAAEAAIWSVALDDDEIEALAQGFSPLIIRPQSLQDYWPCFGLPATNVENNLAGSIGMGHANTDMAAAVHPPIIYPKRKTAVIAPTVAAVSLLPRRNPMQTHLVM